MRKLLIKTKKGFGGKLIIMLTVQLFVFFMPFFLMSSQLDESLVDDVTAMITNARKLAHTTFLIDTSESMNTFVYSDYVKSCEDAQANINSAINLCDNAYNQCREVEKNASCGVNLGCTDISDRCENLRGTRTVLNQFCADVYTAYVEPDKMAEVATPLETGYNDAKKYVGPWDPRYNDIYQLDLCFYNWTEDTGGDVMRGDNSGHWTNPNDGSGGTDRRDWDCLTNGIDAPTFIGGLWLNWKYATSLDAVKIVMGDVHDFSYPPRSRGGRKCVLTKYFPWYNDPVLGKVCYKEFETNPASPLDMDKIKEQVRSNWTKSAPLVVGDESAPECDPVAPKTDTFTIVEETDPFPPDYDPLSVLSSNAACAFCRDFSGAEVPCNEYLGTPGTIPGITIDGIEARVDYTCCKNYECENPKCRDDDTTCRSESSTKPCILGYYSDFDQDQNHCCDMLKCVEEDTGCGDDGTFLPGPGNDMTVQFEKSLGMTPINPDDLIDPDKYRNVTLTGTVKKLDFDDPTANVEKVIITIFYGCDVTGEVPANKIVQKSYTTEVSGSGDGIIAVPFDMTGCEKSGYKVGGTMQLFHSKANFSVAKATLKLVFSLDYNKGSDQPIHVLNPGEFYYLEHRSEVDTVAKKVNEYECKATLYHRQSKTYSGGTSKCPSKHPDYARCINPDHTVIAKNQWGTALQTACTWLCRDDVVYEDVWKCRNFFSQMDDVARGGSGTCNGAGLCPGDNPATLEACCTCINNNQGVYNQLVLEPPERVKFSASGALLNCSVGMLQEGMTSSGKRVYTSGYQAEIITGHIKELNDASYKLNEAGYVSPYTTSTDPWYSGASLLNRSNSFLANSFVSIFETGKNDQRDVACIYDIVNSFSGEDCQDPFGSSCCSVDLGESADMCDYPNFWMKIPNTEGGKLIYPAKILSGSELANYKNVIKSLQARGGSALGETLYDVWRYLGGMKAAHDPNYTGGYVSPFQSADPTCFMNDAIIISGGQPQFDDNSSIKSKTTQPGVCKANLPPVLNDLPCVLVDSADNPTPIKPYVRKNWYLTSLERAAKWVHTKDFWHSENSCKNDNNVNIFGYEIGGTSNPGGINCSTAGGKDTSGLNVIDKIHTIAIGEWVLAGLYNSPDNNYLEDSVLKNAATKNGGQYFGLTAKGALADPGDDIKTFLTLTELFNSFAKSGSPADVASGRPHFTSPLIQPFDIEQKARGPETYSPVTIPVDNRISRFWFGNLKKYTVDDGSSGCNLEVKMACGGWEQQTIPGGDCFAPSDTGTEITQSEFKLLSAGGAAKKLKDMLDSTGVSCDGVVGSNSACFTSGARKVLYDDGALSPGASLLQLKTANANDFVSFFALNNEGLPTGITKGQAISILDYMYGYDAFDDDANGSKNHVRFANDPTVVVDDPFDIDFAGAKKVTIRKLLLGAITHSKPIAVHYINSDNTRVFAGGNDGMLHSFIGASPTSADVGKEAFAYIPKPVMPALTSFLDPRQGIFFNSSVDGPISLFHIDYNNDGIINGVEKAYIIFGYRRGAEYYTVLDVSEMDDPKFVQHIKVEGQSWGKPLVFRKCGITECRLATDLTYYLALPGGYDPCFDSDTPTCFTGGSGLDPKGNEIYIYKFNNTKFDLIKKYDVNTASSANIRDTGWMKTSFTSGPIGISTSSKFSLNTEFVYFSDISSTMFRVDVRDASPENWKFRAIFKQRELSQPIPWTSGIRTYTGVNYYPPMTQYPVTDELIPIPMVTGNLVNPKASEIDEMIVIYDRLNFIDSDDPMNSNNLKNMSGSLGLMEYSASLWTGFNGWKDTFLSPVTEKGIANPLIVYDRFEYNTYSLAWNTYIPNELTLCRNFGTSRNYMKNLINGVAPKLGENSDNTSSDQYRNKEYWDPVEQCSFPKGISIATEVSVIATNQGEDITFSSGHDIFRRRGPTQKENVTNIIKWYELY